MCQKQHLRLHLSGGPSYVELATPFNMTLWIVAPISRQCLVIWDLTHRKYPWLQIAADRQIPAYGLCCFWSCCKSLMLQHKLKNYLAVSLACRVYWTSLEEVSSRVKLSPLTFPFYYKHMTFVLVPVRLQFRFFCFCLRKLIFCLDFMLVVFAFFVESCNAIFLLNFNTR